MGRLLVKALPGAMVAVAAATVAVVALRTYSRWREERNFALAWDAYRQANG